MILNHARLPVPTRPRAFYFSSGASARLDERPIEGVTVCASTGSARTVTGSYERFDKNLAKPPQREREGTLVVQQHCSDKIGSTRLPLVPAFAGIVNVEQFVDRIRFPPASVDRQCHSGRSVEQYLRNLESMSRQVQKAQHFRFLSALRSVRNDMCTRHARHVAYLLFIE